MADEHNPFGLKLAVAFVETPRGEALREFYGTVLGLGVRKEFGTTWTEYATRGANLAVHQPPDLEGSEEPALYLSFEVQDLDGLRSKISAAGTTCTSIRERDRGRFFTCKDPEGVTLHFIAFDRAWRSA